MTLSTSTSQYPQKIYGKSTFSNKQAFKADRMAEVASKRKMSSVKERVNVIKKL
jgi:hypothetical protein